MCETRTQEYAYKLDLKAKLQSDGEWVTGGSARSHDATRASFSYSGSGNYWHDVPGGKVGGAIRESGFNTSHRLQDTTSNLPTGGEWTSQGVGDGHTAWSWNFEYSGSGDYSYSPMGGLVSGTVLESGDRGASYREEYTEKFSDADGWRRTSGIRKNANRQRDAFSYSGSGHYTYDVPGGQVFGDVVESGGHMHFADQNQFLRHDTSTPPLLRSAIARRIAIRTSARAAIPTRWSAAKWMATSRRAARTPTTAPTTGPIRTTRPTTFTATIRPRIRTRPNRAPTAIRSSARAITPTTSWAAR